MRQMCGNERLVPGLSAPLDLGKSRTRRFLSTSVNIATLPVLLLASVLASAADPGQSSDLPYRMDRTVRIPVQDGILLAAVVYRPVGNAARLPVIAMMTPYTADASHET